MRGLLSKYGIDRVYILGAGFSAPLGMPLTGELLREIHGVASRKPWYGEGGKPYPNGQGDWLVDELQWYFPLEAIDHGSIRRGSLPQGFDIEKFLSYAASTSACLYRTGERWNEHGDKFTAFLKGWLAEVIVTRQAEALIKVPDQYVRFAKSLNSALVLTFNWDTVLESLLEHQGLAFGFDLHSTYNTAKVPLIKLHGSIDWFSAPPAEQVKPWMEFESVSDSFERCRRAKSDLLRYYGEYLTPWIVVPSYDKIFQILALGDTWQAPWIFLQDNLEVIVIGFSMRPDDFHSRAFLYPQIVRGTRLGYLKVKVVDLASNETQRQAIVERFAGVNGCKFFFGGFSNEALDFIEAI